MPPSDRKRYNALQLVGKHLLDWVLDNPGRESVKTLKADLPLSLQKDVGDLETPVAKS